MRFFRSTLAFGLLLPALFLALIPASLRAAPGVTVEGQIEEGGPSEAQQKVLFDEGVAAYDAGNFTQAYEIWLPLAQRDDLAAMRNVALLLREGRGVERDPERALYFYERAARGGLVSAQLNTAFMYLEGDGIPQDYKTASFWFHAAAIAGVPAARYNLGVMYEKGLGVEKDPARALAWYALAAKVGHQGALERLTELVPSLPGPPPPSDADAAHSRTAPPPQPAEFDRLDHTEP